MDVVGAFVLPSVFSLSLFSCTYCCRRVLRCRVRACGACVNLEVLRTLRLWDWKRLVHTRSETVLLPVPFAEMDNRSVPASCCSCDLLLVLFRFARILLSLSPSRYTNVHYGIENDLCHLLLILWTLHKTDSRWNNWSSSLDCWVWTWKLDVATASFSAPFSCVLSVYDYRIESRRFII